MCKMQKNLNRHQMTWNIKEQQVLLYKTQGERNGEEGKSFHTTGGTTIDIGTKPHESVLGQ